MTKTQTKAKTSRKRQPMDASRDDRAMSDARPPFPEHRRITPPEVREQWLAECQPFIASDDDPEGMARFLAGLVPGPGEEVPDWYVVCPVCDGAGCATCFDLGGLHPRRVGWVEDWMANVWAAEEWFDQLAERLPRHLSLPARLRVAELKQTYVLSWSEQGLIPDEPHQNDESAERVLSEDDGIPWAC